MCFSTEGFGEEFKGANFNLKLQFILLLESGYFCISARCRVCRRYQRELVSALEESFVELPVPSIEHTVGVQEAEIAFVGFLRST